MPNNYETRFSECRSLPGWPSKKASQTGEFPAAEDVRKQNGLKRHIMRTEVEMISGRCTIMFAFISKYSLAPVKLRLTVYR